MSIGAILVGFSLLIATAPFIASPLLNEKRKKPAPDVLEQPPLSDLHSQALSALRDLEFDHQLEKVNVEDYANSRASLLAQAAATLEAKEKQSAEMDIQLEEAIRSRREKLTAQQAARCSHCGGTVEASDCFCRACGQPVGKVCPNCAGKVKPNDLYCSGCGAALAKPITTSQETAQPTQSGKEVSE